MKTLSKSKGVKEKVEKIIVDYMRNPNSNSLYVPVKVLDKIDKLYRKELLKEKWEVEIKYHALPERRKIKSTYDEQMEQFMKENPMIIDDQIPDAFDSWLSFKKNENPTITVNWTGNTTDNLESK